MHIGFDALAVEIAAGGDAEVVLTGQGEIEGGLGGGVAGIIALDGVQTTGFQVDHQLFQTFLVILELVGMGKGGIAAGAFNGLDAGLGCRLWALNAGKFRRIQVFIERFAGILDVMAGHQSLGEVGTAGAVDLLGGQGDTPLPQIVQNPRAPLPPALLELLTQTGQRRGAVLEMIGQKVEIPVLPGG